FAGPIPFEQRELGMVERTSLAVAERARELEDARLAGGEQLLACELGRCAQIPRRAAAVWRGDLRRKRMEMRLIAGRYLKDGGLDVDEIPRGEEGTQCRDDAPPRDQERPAIGMALRVPKQGWLPHRSASFGRGSKARKSLELAPGIAMVRAGIGLP